MNIRQYNDQRGLTARLEAIKAVMDDGRGKMSRMNSPQIKRGRVDWCGAVVTIKADGSITFRDVPFPLQSKLVAAGFVPVATNWTLDFGDLLPIGWQYGLRPKADR